MSKKSKKEKKDSERMEWSKADDDKLFLKDMNPKNGHLSNLSTNKNGKEVSVGQQISDYLKSMQLLEKSVEDLEVTVEKSDKKLREVNLLSELKIIKKKYRGKVYSSTPDIVRAVKLEASGKISYENLREMTSWHEDPEGLIEVSRMIAGIGRFRR